MSPPLGSLSWLPGYISPCASHPVGISHFLLTNNVMHGVNLTYLSYLGACHNVSIQAGTEWAVNINTHKECHELDAVYLQRISWRARFWIGCLLRDVYWSEHWISFPQVLSPPTDNVPRCSGASPSPELGAWQPETTPLARLLGNRGSLFSFCLGVNKGRKKLWSPEILIWHGLVSMATSWAYV